MKIAFLHSIFPGIGGTETVTMNLLTGFRKLGHECVIIAFNQSQLLLPKGLNIFFLNKNNNNERNNIDKQLLRLVKAEGINIIVNQGPFWVIPDDWPCNECKIVSVLHYEPRFRISNIKSNIDKQFHIKQSNLKKRIVSYIRYVMKSYFSNRDFRRDEQPVITQIVRNSNAFVVLCPDYINTLGTIYGLKNLNNVVAIPNPYISKSSANILDYPKKNKILYVGRLTFWDKRVDRLLKIWHVLENKYPEWSLDIVGDGEDRSSLEQLSSKLALKRVVFHGFKDPTPFYRDASILCLTSESEGFGMVVLESADYLCPTVAYSVSEGIRSIIKSSETGILVQPFKQDDYIESLESLMGSKEKRHKMALNARKSISNYSLDTICRQWQMLFDNLNKNT